jgi:hypothetical protein
MDEMFCLTTTPVFLRFLSTSPIIYSVDYYFGHALMGKMDGKTNDFSAALHLFTIYFVDQFCHQKQTLCISQLA